MNLSFYFPPETQTVLAQEIKKQQEALDALTSLQADLDRIDVQRSPQEALEAVARLQAVLLVPIENVPDIHSTLYLFRRLFQSTIGMQEAANLELDRRRKQALVDAQEKAEALRIRTMLAKHAA